MSYTSRYGLLAVSGTFLGLTLPAIALRIYARKQQRMPIGADDAFAVIGYVSVLGPLLYIHRLPKIFTDHIRRRLY